MSKLKFLKSGDKAPKFKLENENEEVVQLSDFKGEKLVLYFYPKDNTPTCTVEACNLRDNYKALQKAGYTVLGISPDSAKKHQNFIKKFDLPFSLLCDTESIMSKAYGVWGYKKFMGKEYDGMHRSTFLIDEKGKISEAIYSVKSKVHAEQILNVDS